MMKTWCICYLFSKQSLLISVELTSWVEVQRRHCGTCDSLFLGDPGAAWSMHADILQSGPFNRKVLKIVYKGRCLNLKMWDTRDCKPLRNHCDVWHCPLSPSIENAGAPPHPPSLLSPFSMSKFHLAGLSPSRTKKQQQTFFADCMIRDQNKALNERNERAAGQKAMQVWGTKQRSQPRTQPRNTSKTFRFANPLAPKALGVSLPMP